MKKPGKINTELFRYDNSAQYLLVSLSRLFEFNTIRDFTPLCPIIGYCKANETNMYRRDTPNDYMVLFELEGDNVWCHVPKKLFDIYLVEAA
jgi:hypothetical protein